MILHLNNQLFSQSIRFTAQKLKIPEIYIEKDYWVTFALQSIFKNEIGKETIFKGGTSLSKCFNLIERFSEDIDLVVIRKEGESDYKIKKKIKEISEAVNKVLPEIEIQEVTRKMGMNRKTVHSYAKEFQGNYGQVRDVVIVEATCFGYHEPYSIKTINSFVGNMMLDGGQFEIAMENDLLPFEVLVMEPTRTFCEKIMSLVRFSYSPDAIGDLQRKIRHIYDLHHLLLQKELENFFHSVDFESMLLKVAKDDITSFRNNNEWLNHHPSNSLVFKKQKMCGIN